MRRIYVYSKLSNAADAAHEMVYSQAFDEDVSTVVVQSRELGQERFYSPYVRVSQIDETDNYNEVDYIPQNVAVNSYGQAISIMF